MSRLWSNEEESIVPQGKGQSKVIERTLIDDLNFTCILNSDVMSSGLQDMRMQRQKGKQIELSFGGNMALVRRTLRI